MKVCTKCKINKKISEFGKDKGSKDGLTFRCRSCMREYENLNRDRINKRSRKYYWEHREQKIRYQREHREERKEYNKRWHKDHKNQISDVILKRNYGISLKEKEDLFNKQKGKCAICKVKIINFYTAHVDHSHENKKVRGLLCKRCNPMLGMAKDNIGILKNAIKYLEKNK